jgi:hypothetical protein
MRRLLAAIALLALAGSAAAAQTMTNQGPVEVPLRLAGGRLLVPIEGPDGTELQFALSTGTPVTVLSASTAARLSDGAKLTVGGVALDLESSQTVPDKDLMTDGIAIDGMIGSNLLNQFDELIDVPRGRLVLKQAGRSVEWDGMTLSDPVRLRVYHGIVLGLEVEMNGTEYGAMLDLGTPAIIVNPDAKNAMQIADSDVATMRLGEATFSKIPVQVRDLDIFRRWRPDGGGFVLVGAAITQDCAISISWIHSELRTCVP